MSDASERSEILRRASEHWSRVTKAGTHIKRHWWQSPAIVSYINESVGGRPGVSGLHVSFHDLLKAKLGGKVALRALSIACGSGSKEMQLVHSGAVDHFDLYEISQTRIAEGRQRARDLKIEHRLRFHEADAFEHCKFRNYDLIYWNNALHHMLDVEHAIAWSLEHLRPGGWFAMDDFVGPSRFQWTDRTLDYATRFRSTLPDTYMIDVDAPEQMLPREALRPSEAGLIEMDPTEAADSARILPCLAQRLPDAQVIRTGGAIYVVGLHRILPHFNEADDLPLLRTGLLLDRALNETGDTLYGVAIGQKN